MVALGHRIMIVFGDVRNIIHNAIKRAEMSVVARGAKGGSVVSTAILTPQSFLPSEYKQSEWDWNDLVRGGGLIIHTLLIENSSERL